MLALVSPRLSQMRLFVIIRWLQLPLELSDAAPFLPQKGHRNLQTDSVQPLTKCFTPCTYQVHWEADPASTNITAYVIAEVPAAEPVSCLSNPTTNIMKPSA